MRLLLLPPLLLLLLLRWQCWPSRGGVSRKVEMGVMMVGALLILWLLKGVLYGRMSSDVVIIETVGSVFILLDSLSQPRGSSMSCWVRGRGCDPNLGFSHRILNSEAILSFICIPKATFRIFLTASGPASPGVSSASKLLFAPGLVEVIVAAEPVVLHLHFPPTVALPQGTLISPGASRIPKLFAKCP